MKRDIETIRSIVVVAIAVLLLAFVVWTLATVDARALPPELPTATAPAPWGTPDTGTPIAPYPPPPGDPYPPPYPPPGDGYPAPYPAPVYLPFTAGESYP